MPRQRRWRVLFVGFSTVPTFDRSTLSFSALVEVIFVCLVSYHSLCMS
jgi:hypothetical protein